MENTPRIFLKAWCIACVTSCLLVAGFVSAMDPYSLLNTPQIQGFNARKPSVDATKLLRTAAYDVLESDWKTLLVGASTVVAGMDKDSRAWPASLRPMYKLAFPATGPYVSYRYLQHVLSQRHVDLVVLGLEFDFFLDTWMSASPGDSGFESRLAITSEGLTNSGVALQRIYDVAQGTLTLDALTDSVSTLTESVRGLYDAAPTGLTPPGSYPWVTFMNVYSIKEFRGRIRYEAANVALRNILELCKAKGTRLIVFINPTRADRLEIIERTGYWPAFEDWKRELVMLTRQDGSGRNSQIELWDFSGYDQYSAEEIYPDGRTLHWFADSVHYNPTLGDVIIARIFGTGDGQYGTRLGPENIEAHLAFIRNQQYLYRMHRPSDVQRINTVFAATLR